MSSRKAATAKAAATKTAKKSKTAGIKTAGVKAQTQSAAHAEVNWNEALKEDVASLAPDRGGGDKEDP